MARFLLFFLLCTLISSVQAETRVTTKKLGDVAFYPEATIPATALSLNNSKISAQVQAVVKSIPVLVGESVKRGNALILLDDRDYKLNLKQAEVAFEGATNRLNFAIYQLNQATELAKDNLLADEILEQRKTNVMTLKSEKDSLRVTVDQAKRNLAKSVIRAPFDAVITERIAQVGELANPGTPLMQIVDVEHVEVSAKMQSHELTSMDGSDEFYFKTDERSYQLDLRKITPIFDAIQRNKEARFTFSGPRAVPGATGIVQWTNKQPHVPAELIVRRGRQLGVFVANRSTAQFVPLSRAQEGRPSFTLLPETTDIIIDGRYNVQDGDPITVTRLR